MDVPCPVHIKSMFLLHLILQSLSKSTKKPSLVKAFDDLFISQEFKKEVGVGSLNRISRNSAFGALKSLIYRIYFRVGILVSMLQFTAVVFIEITFGLPPP